MQFQTPLLPARLIRRYKRFLADIRLEDGSEVTAHCPNPGAMLGLKDPETKIWVEPNDDPRRKLKYAWRLTELENGHWVGIDTVLPNRIVQEALEQGKIPELTPHTGLKAEVKYGTNSRIDFLLTDTEGTQTYVEVKNSHLCRNNDMAEFPDSVTSRGKKHLEELAAVSAAGHRAVLLFVVQRTDCTRFKLASDIDPQYAAAFDKARAAGVEVLCYGTDISTQGISIAHRIPFN